MVGELKMTWKWPYHFFLFLFSLYYLVTKQLPIFILLPRRRKKIILQHNVVQFTWMISHRFDSFIAFLRVHLSPVLGSWEQAHDNPSKESLKAWEVSVVYVADGQRIDPLVECWVNFHTSPSSRCKCARIRAQVSPWHPWQVFCSLYPKASLSRA